MPVIGLTWKQVRTQVARNLMGESFVASAPTYAGSTTTIIDNKLRHVEPGSWVLGTGGTIDGDLARVDSFEPSGHTIKVEPALSAATATSHTYEIYDSRYPPALLMDFANQAIDRAAGRFYAREESVALHGDGAQLRYDLPSEFAMVDKIEYRKRVSSKEVHACDKVFDEATDSDITIAIDTEIKKRGSSSIRFTVGAGVSNGDLVSDSISSTDYSFGDTLEGWVKCTTALASGDLNILLDNTASCASPVETLTVPAIAADTWTYFRVSLATPELCTAIISVGLEYNANAGANTIWLDRLSVVANDTAEWEKLSKRSWSLDREGNDIIFTRDGANQIGYALLKISGGSYPTRVTGDTSVLDIPEQYIVNATTAFALMGNSMGRENDPEDRRGMSAYWVGAFAEAERKFPRMQNARKID